MLTENSALPLSPAQEIVWFHEQLFPAGHVYHFTAVLDLHGTLDVPALRTALERLLRRHRGLRLALVPGDGSAPRQRAYDECRPRYRFVDLSGGPGADLSGGPGKEDFDGIVREQATTPFDLYEAPLVRWTLVRLGPAHHRLVHVEHHLVHDGRSFAVLLRDLFALYRELAHDLPADLPPAADYVDFVELTDKEEARKGRQDGVEYWTRKLSGASTRLSLPGLASARRPRRSGQELHGAQARHPIDAATAARLREVSREQGQTPFLTLLGLFGELLRRHTAAEELVVGTAVDARPPRFQEAVGMFVNTLAVRLGTDPARPAVEVIDDIAEYVVRGLVYADAPVQEVTRGLHRYSADLRNPLFHAMFSAHDAPLPELEVPGLDVSLLEGFNPGVSRFDLDVVLMPDDRRRIGPRDGGGGMTLVWDYDDALFDRSAVDTLHDRLLALLRDYLDHPRTPLDELTAHQAGSAPAAPAPADAARAGKDAPRTVDPVRAGAATHPRNPALISGVRTLDYAELDALVEQLAHRFTECGVRPGHLVACLLPRGTDWVVALLACLRLGAVVCPLSPVDPVDRLAATVRALRPAVTLVQPDSEPPAGLPVTVIEDGAVVGALPGVPGEARTVPDAACVLHTSGSTGRPKPIVVGREALAHHMAAVTEVFALSAEDRALGFAQPWFDVSLEEILPTLHAGGAVVLPRQQIPAAPELVSLAAARGVTVANLPTSYFLVIRQELMDAFRHRRWPLRLLVLGGERLAATPVCELAEVLDGTVLNAYGVAEATITSTVHRVGTADGERPHGEVPLGLPLPGIGVHIVDDRLRPLDRGMVGQIAVSGAGLAAGYLDVPEQQAARFRELRATDGTSVPVYLTGDLGYLDADGELGFLGRRDNQIKLRGHRVELEEVEAHARAVLGDVPCAVVHDTEGPYAPRLVGFARGPGESLPHVSRGLAGRLPAQLIPALWVALDELPTLPGGKPDRTTLTRWAREATHAPADPADPAGGRPADEGHPTLALLKEGWQLVLGHDDFGERSHFFRVGGHSLLVVHLAGWLESRLGARPPMQLVLQHPVLTELADELTRWLAAQPSATPQRR
ncbi:non-ribosomal peptide synthetase [Streptomyces iconiensis]|uniref:AMP-binding protein n=1 Tax=Streptomyces iconiensis TaxID=1384038 RepID=A0ABT6ZSH8_9ACTN|nr:condensation domain-containing protein [Streptomyces iconiensis]MDJ1131413.1 AMP-binding protein [Streptomyces iconiensis]